MALSRTIHPEYSNYLQNIPIEANTPKACEILLYSLSIFFSIINKNNISNIIQIVDAW